MIVTYVYAPFENECVKTFLKIENNNEIFRDFPFSLMNNNWFLLNNLCTFMFHSFVCFLGVWLVSNFDDQRRTTQVRNEILHNFRLNSIKKLSTSLLCVCVCV